MINRRILRQNASRKRASASSQAKEIRIAVLLNE
jgi:hypothetical protein